MVFATATYKDLQRTEEVSMTEPSPRNITQMLIDWSNGDREALESLIPVVYRELRRQAARHMRREHAGHTLQTTALVNAGRPAPRAVAEPHALLRRRRAVDAPHPCRSRAAAPSLQAWRVGYRPAAGRGADGGG